MRQHKVILLIDLDDPRCETRVHLLQAAGYEVKVRKDWIASERIDHEGTFDLVIIAIHRRDLKAAAEYSDRVARWNPTLPILLVTDAGVFAPRGTVSRSVESGDPAHMMETIASMLSGSAHIREIDHGTLPI